MAFTSILTCQCWAQGAQSEVGVPRRLGDLFDRVSSRTENQRAGETLRISNDAGDQPLCQVHVAFEGHGNSKSWGPNRLLEPLAPGGAITFLVPAGSSYDVLVESCDGEWTLHMDGLRLSGSFEISVPRRSEAPPAVLLTNLTDEPICYLLFQPANSKQPTGGRNWLGADPLPPGDKRVLLVPPGEYNVFSARQN